MVPLMYRQGFLTVIIFFMWSQASEENIIQPQFGKIFVSLNFVDADQSYFRSVSYSYEYYECNERIIFFFKP